MAKTLKQILDGVKSSKIKDKDILGSKPGVDYRPKSGDEQKFADKHKIEQHADRVGNEDDIYQANNINYTMNKKGHGYKSGEDEKVYEEAKCNMTEAGSMCEAHGMKKCPPVLKEKPVKEDIDGGYDISEGRIVDTKHVMNSRGGEDRYELHHSGTGAGWHSIIKTHQDGKDLHAMHGFHSVVHVGSEKYVRNKWKGIKHSDSAYVNSAAEPVKEETIDEISRGLASRYLNKTNPDYSSPTEVQKRKAGRELALKKKWGDKNFGTAEPRVKATEEVEQIDEILIQQYISGPKNKSAQVRKNMNTDNYSVKKITDGTVVGISNHDDVSAAHAAAKKHISEGYGNDLSRGLSTGSLIKKNTGHKVHFNTKSQMIHTDSNKVITQNADNHSVPELIQHAKNFKEEVEQIDEKKRSRNILVTMKGEKGAGGVKRIRQSEYDPKIHSLAERAMSATEVDKREEIVKGMKKKLGDFRKRYGKRAKDVMYATATKQAMKEDIKESVIPANSPIRDYKRKDVSGLYNFSHLEHPNGNYIQHNQNKYVHYNKKTGEHKSFSRTKSGLADLINHVNKVHSIKEDIAQPLIGATSTPPRENSDGEAAMVKTELRAIANKAMHLVTQMPQGMDIEPWVQSKIAQAKQMVSSVHDYMIYGNHDEKEQTDTPITFPNTNVDTGRI
jgi:hypothetical protein